MPVDSSHRSRGRFLFTTMALIIFGLCVFYFGYQGLIEGNAVVSFRSGKHFVAYANGPHAESFVFKVWWWMIVGGGMAALGVFRLMRWLFGGLARRERILFSASAMRSRRVRVSGWVASASLVIGAFVFAYVYAATRV